MKKLILLAAFCVGLVAMVNPIQVVRAAVRQSSFRVSPKAICDPAQILIIYSDNGISPTTLQNQTKTLTGVASVDLFNAEKRTPTLTDLENYQAVVVTSNTAFADPVALGDVLATYQDNGGIVVAFNFDWYGQPLGIGGRWQSGGYAPFFGGTNKFVGDNLGNYTQHPLMEGVTFLEARYRMQAFADANATVVASWSDGTPLVAYKNRAVGLTAYVGDYGGYWSGDFAKIIVNAHKWLSGCVPGPTPTPTPTPVACQEVGNWTNTTQLPTDEFGAAVGSGGGNAFGGEYVYAASGYSLSRRAIINQFVRINPLLKAKSWQNLAPIPVPVFMGTGVFASGTNKFYVFGGNLDMESNVTNQVQIYDGGSNSWSIGTMPEPRAFMAGAYSNGRFYLAGGSTGGTVETAQNQLWVYDTALNSWKSKAALPQALAGATGQIVNGHFYVIGGRDISGVVLNTIYDYDITADTWTQKTNLPTAINVAGSTVSNGKIIVFGGGDPFLGNRNSPTTKQLSTKRTLVGLNQTQIYNPVKNIWTSGPNQIRARSFQGGGITGGMILSVGGWGEGGTERTVEMSQQSVCK